MVNIVPRTVWTPHPNLMVAFVGLEGDVQSLKQELQIQVSSKLGRALGFSLGEQERHISPRALASITSHILYQRRGAYYVEPLVVGLHPSSGEPFLCAMDMIGAQSFSTEFVCAGAASKREPYARNQKIYLTYIYRVSCEPTMMLKDIGRRRM